MMDKFFADYLAPITDMSGQDWDWQKRLAARHVNCRSTRCRQFQRASDIRSAFFPDGGPTPNVQLTIAPHTVSRDADMALLEVNQVVLQTSLAGNAPISLAWPGNGGSGTANISLYPELPGRNPRLGKEGPWALMRLIDAGSVTKNGRDAARALRHRRPRGVLRDQDRIVLQSAVPAVAEDFKCPVAF